MLPILVLIIKIFAASLCAQYVSDESNVTIALLQLRDEMAMMLISVNNSDMGGPSESAAVESK